MTDAAQDRRRHNLQLCAAQRGSNSDLADALGISRSYISQMINGQRPVSEKTARKIEAMLRLAPGWFDQDRTGVPPQPAPTDPGLIARATTAVKIALDQAGIDLEAEKFGELVTLVYEQALASQNQQVDGQMLQRLIQLVR